MLSDFVCNFALSVITLSVRMQPLRQVIFLTLSRPDKPSFIKSFGILLQKMLRHYGI